MDHETLAERFCAHQIATQNYYEIPLKTIINRFLVNYCKELQELKVLAASGQPSVDSKKGILFFIHTSRRKLAKLLALVCFVAENPSLSRCLAIRILGEQALKSTLADRLFQIQSGFAGARLPPFDCRGALDVLCRSGDAAYSAPKSLPSIMHNWRAEQPSIPLEEYLNNVIRWLLCTGDFAAEHWASATVMQLQVVCISGGLATLLAPKEFELQLTAVYDPHSRNWNWMLLDICVLVGVEIEGEQMDQLKYRCNDLLQSSTDQINPPIKRLYNYLHKFCLQLALAHLYEQSVKSSKIALDLDVSLSEDCLRLELTVWPKCQIELFGKHAVCISLKEAVGDKSFTKLKAEFTGGKAPLDFQTNLPLSLTLDPSDLNFERIANLLTAAYAAQRLHTCRLLIQKQLSQAELPTVLESERHLSIGLVSAGEIQATSWISGRLSVRPSSGQLQLELSNNGSLVDRRLFEYCNRLTVEINEDINRLPSTLLRLRAAVLVRLLCSLATCWRLQYHADLPLQASQCISFISPGPEQKCFFQFPSLRTSFIMLEIGGGGIDCETVEISLLCTRLHLNQGAISYEPFSKQSIGTTQFSRGFQLSLRPLVELMNNAVGRGWRLCLAETLSRQLAQLPDDLLACYGFSNQKMESTQLPINSTAYPRSLYRISLPPAPSVAGQLLDGVVLEIAQRTNCSDLFSVEVFAVICYADRNEPYTILRSPDVEDCVLGLLERVFIISTCRALVMKLKEFSIGPVEFAEAAQTVQLQVDAKFMLTFQYDTFGKRFRVSTSPPNRRKRPLCAQIEQLLSRPSPNGDSLMEKIILFDRMERELVTNMPPQLSARSLRRSPQYLRLSLYAGKYFIDLRLLSNNSFIISDGSRSVFDPLGFVHQQPSSSSHPGSPATVANSPNISPILGLATVKRIPKLSVLFDAVASNYWRQKHGFTGTVPFSLVTASKTFLSHIGIPETGSDKLGWMSMVLRAVINWVVVHDCFDCAKSALLERGIGDTIVDSSQQGLQLSFSAAGSFVQIWYNYQTFDWRVQLTSTRPKGKMIDLSAVQLQIAESLNSCSAITDNRVIGDPLSELLQNLTKLGAK